ncbi:MAG: phasin family protein, partial [Pseudomonadota bacterium]
EKKIADAVKVDEIVNNTSKIADSAREFVKRSAATAKERSDNLYEGSTKLNSGLEKVLSRAVTGYVGFLGNIAEAAHANVDHALTTAEKLAAAKTLSEAAQIQADYVRENTSANVERVRAAVNSTRETVMEGAEVVRENVSKVWPYGKAA